MSFDNVYNDAQRAAAYAKLEFPGTYYLAFRDLPDLINKYVIGKQALDFGCGTGRSTRFLQKLGLQAIGVDIAEEMIENARELDAKGEYCIINEDNLSQLPGNFFDLVLSAFTFDNIPTSETKLKNLAAIRNLLNPDGIMINLVSSPDVYAHEWASFTTKEFLENRRASDGDIVRIVMKDVEDQRPVEDVVWSDKAYRDLYKQAKLELVKTYKPLAREDEPYEWITETKIAPWVIYVLKRNRTR